MSTSGTSARDPRPQPIDQGALPRADRVAVAEPRLQRDGGGEHRRYVRRTRPATVLVVVDRIRGPPARRAPQGQHPHRDRPAEGARRADQRRPRARVGQVDPAQRGGGVQQQRHARLARRSRPPPRRAAACRPRGWPPAGRPAPRPSARDRGPPRVEIQPAEPINADRRVVVCICGRQHRGMIDRGGDHRPADPRPARGETGDRGLHGARTRGRERRSRRAGRRGAGDDFATAIERLGGHPARPVQPAGSPQPACCAASQASRASGRMGSADEASRYTVRARHARTYAPAEHRRPGQNSQRLRRWQPSLILR